MIPTWQPCEIGEPLYQAMCVETDALAAAGWEDEGLYTMNREAWARWHEHAQGCPDCRIERE